MSGRLDFPLAFPTGLSGAVIRRLRAVPVLGSIARRVASGRAGRRLVEALAPLHLDVCAEAIGRHDNERATFGSAGNLPAELRGFEDLAWLFTASPLNRGIARLDLDEAAYLYRFLGAAGAISCVEIGRFKGGSTFLIAAALSPGSKLVSIDNHSKMQLPSVGPRLDSELRAALERFGLAERVTLAVGDSGTYPAPAESVDVVFLDGDHTYEGVKRDFEHWRKALTPGGSMLFHDATRARPNATVHDGVARLVAEIERDRQLTRLRDVGSVVHFRASS